MRKFAVAVVILLFHAALGWTVPISDVKEIDKNGLPVKMGQVVTVSGVVTVANLSFNSSGIDFYIEDATGGIRVNKRRVAAISIELGDSVAVTGIIDVDEGSTLYNGNTKLVPLSTADIVVFGRADLPDPVRIGSLDLRQEVTPPCEPYEGLLVELVNVSFDTTLWNQGSGDFDIEATDGDTVFTIHIDADTDIIGSQTPASPVIVVGVVVQNDPSRPYLADYTLWPRSRADFIRMGSGSGYASVEPSIVEIGSGEFDLSVKVTGNGVDTIEGFTVEIPSADGWSWIGQDAELAGPGVQNATFEVTGTGVTVQSCSIRDEATYGEITIKGIVPPGVAVVSEVRVTTSVDGISFDDIEQVPLLRAIYPLGPVVISEVYPDDDQAISSDAFVELYNAGAEPATLEGAVLCEVTGDDRCQLVIRYILSSSDSIAPGDYFVIAQSSDGFRDRFGFEPDLEAPVSPLGRLGGDGITCAGEPAYEAISLWREASLSILVDYVEYGDTLSCADELCSDFTSRAFPMIPPVGYGLINHTSHEPWSGYDVTLTGIPTPGEPNRIGYLKARVTGINSHSNDVTEVTFSEPLRSVSADDFLLNGNSVLDIYQSLSGEKVVLFTSDQPGGTATLEITGVAGIDLTATVDTVITFKQTSVSCKDGCEIQAFDQRGFSPLNGSDVCMIGFVTVPPGIFQPSYSSLYVQALDGCGVNVFSYDVPSPRPELGDLIMVRGKVEEYVGSSAGSTTELYMSSPSGLTILSGHYPEPEPLVLKTGEVGNESNEGRLIETEGAIVSASAHDFYIDDGSGGIQIYQNFTSIDFGRYRVGMYVRVKGVLLQYDYTRPFLEGYELVPRYESDIEIIEDAFPQDVLLKGDSHVFCPSCGDGSYRIAFGGKSSSQVVMRIFDGAGRLVRTLYSGSSVGKSEVFWDGTGDDGKPVPPGLYICFIEVVEKGTGRVATRSMPIVVGTQLR